MPRRLLTPVPCVVVLVTCGECSLCGRTSGIGLLQPQEVNEAVVEVAWDTHPAIRMLVGNRMPGHRADAAVNWTIVNPRPRKRMGGIDQRPMQMPTGQWSLPAISG